MKVSVLAREICPPILWNSLARAKAKMSGWLSARSGQDPMQQPVEGKQDLNVYWQPEVAKILERWGEGTAWTEIEFLLVNCRGRVLDIACGPGNNIEMLSRFSALEVHGCDISDYLIGRAIERGIPKDRLRVCDATQMDYPDQTFDYAYSIGSLEHFTESGIAALISEAHRVTRSNTFHMLPVSRSGKDEGWLKTVQSFYNNSTDWWLEKFRATYADVYVLNSKWEDKLSVGKWFVCLKERPA